MSRYLTRREAAEHLTERGFRTSPKTLAKWASIGGGPVYQTFGARRVVYTLDALEQWIAERLSPPRRNTSEGGLYVV